MKAFLYGILLAGLLLTPLAAEADGGGHAAMGTRGVDGQPITLPFQNTLGIARQAAIISRARAQQAISDRITASGDLIGSSNGFFGSGLGEVGGGLALGVPGVAIVGPQAGVAPVAAHPRFITTTQSVIQPGQIQIVRGTSVENVNVPSTN